ncbi:MAG TPA: hypothetical protein ENL34_02565 [Chloroflexi bacterium]|nr:hypothetical protein [Chloroflexota bacterium]
MKIVLAWLTEQVSWVGLICLFGALAYTIVALRAKRNRDYAQFSLERDIYHQRMTRAWRVSALFLLLGGLVAAISTWLAPSPTDLAPTPTPASGLYTPVPGSPTASPLAATTALTEVIVATPVPILTITPTALPTAIAPDLMQPDCPDPGAQITLPAAGSEVSGIVEVLGTAKINAFSYYRFEVLFPGSDAPNFVAQYDRPVENGRLGVWDISDPTRYPSGGPYRFRLVVVDIYGNTTVCSIPVIIATQAED